MRASVYFVAAIKSDFSYLAESENIKPSHVCADIPRNYFLHSQFDVR